MLNAKAKEHEADQRRHQREYDRPASQKDSKKSACNMGLLPPIYPLAGDNIYPKEYRQHEDEYSQGSDSRLAIADAERISVTTAKSARFSFSMGHLPKSGRSVIPRILLVAGAGQPAFLGDSRARWSRQ